jgi:transposase
VNGLTEIGGFKFQKACEIEELQNIFYAEGTGALARKKILVVVMRMSGVNVQETVQVTGASERMVFAYTRQYREHGVAGLIEDKRYKPVSQLKEYQEEIKKEFEKNPPATASEAGERIYRMCGLKRSPTQVRKFLHDLGMNPLKVGHIPAKANIEEQKSFHDTELMRRIEEAQKGERVLLFLDATHILWQVYLGVVWCITRIFIPAASGRVRINVLGAYEPTHNELLKIINKTYVTAATLCEMLEMIKKKYGERETTVILDNARYQKCKIVAEKAEGLGIELLYLPTYSPNLNLIERLWRFVKKDCLYSKYYDTAEKFEVAIHDSLESISSYNQTKVKSLMTLKFQLFDPKTIQKLAA